MKLIDILVAAGDETPLFGVHTKYLAMDPDGRVHGYCDMPSPTVLGWGIPDALYSTDGRGCLIQLDRDDVDGQWQSAIITREQYEAALAAKNDGWIEWGGGECPVNPSEMVDVIFGRGGRVSTNIADCWLWNHSGTDSDIIAYRMHKPQTVNHFEGAPEWAKLRVRHKKDKDEYFIESTETVRYQAIGTKIGNPITFSTEFWDVVATRNLCVEHPEVSEENLTDFIVHEPVTAWNGDGLPPVGCECELMKSPIDAPKRVKIIAHFQNNAAMVAAYIPVENKYKKVDQGIACCFRPLRAETDRKRDEAVQALCNAGGGNGKVDEKAGYGSCWFDVYDAIAAGKIPGVKLED